MPAAKVTSVYTGHQQALERQQHALEEDSEHLCPTNTQCFAPVLRQNVNENIRERAARARGRLEVRAFDHPVFDA